MSESESGSRALNRARTAAKLPRKPPKVHSGTSRSYAERVAKGRPNVTFCLPQETVDLLAALADREGLSRSALVEKAVRAFADEPAKPAPKRKPVA
jgi:hypothetical protein